MKPEPLTSATMPTFPLRSYHNPLIRYLSRHSQVTTLFRFVTPEKALRSATLPESNIKTTHPSSQIVQASLVTHPFEHPQGMIEKKEPASALTRNQRINVVQPSTVRLDVGESKQKTDGNLPISQKPSFSKESGVSIELESPAWQRLDSIYANQQELVEQEQQDIVSSLSTPNDLISNQIQPTQSISEVKQGPPDRIDTGQTPQRPIIQRAINQPQPVMSTPLFQPLPQTNPPAPSSSESTITDDVWRRLQAIYNAHQEKELREKAAVQDRVQKAATTRKGLAVSDSSAPAGESPVELKAAEPATKHIDNSSAETNERFASTNQTIQKFEYKQSALENPQPAGKTGSERIIAPAPNPLQRAWQQVQNVFGKRPEGEETLPKPGADQGDILVPETLKNNRSPEAMEAVTSGAQPDQPSIQPKQVASQSHTFGIEQDIQKKQSDETEAGMKEISDGLQQQRLPLEAVWAVEQREDLPLANANKTETPPEILSSARAEFPWEKSQEIHRILQKVEPQQQTDSHIEVISPRHGRPLASPSIQAMPAEPTESEQDKSPVDILQIRREPEASPQETDGRPRTAAAPNPELKQLWNLLDDMHPLDAESKASEGEVIPRTALPTSGGNQEVANAIQRAEEPDLHLDRMATEVSFPTLISAEPMDVSPIRGTAEIQKQDATTNIADQSLLGSTTGEKQGKADINELARQVYSEVRRRIALEWERKRF